MASQLKPLPDELLDEVRANLDKARSHIATVDVEADVEGAALVVDGGDKVSLPATGLRLTEGRHSLVASALGEEDVEREVDLPGGKTTTVSLSFAGDEPPPLPPEPPDQKPVRASDGGAGPWRPLGMVLGGVGLLTTGVGVATLVGGVAMDESADDQKALYNVRYSGGCPPEDQTLCAYDAAEINNQVDRAAALQTTGVVLTIFGGALLTGGILMIALAPDESPAADERAAHPSVACGPYGQVGLGCVGTF